MRWLLLLLSLLFACDEPYTPESRVSDLRVLGVKAQPAELAPGESAQFSALVVDPSRAATQRTLLWISCDPDPFNLGRSACSDIAELQDLATVAAGGDGGTSAFPPGMRFAGFGDVGAYTAPAEVFAPLAADDIRRNTGTVAQILLLAVAEQVSPVASEEERNALLGRITRKEVPFLITLFRIRVSEDAQRNANPVLQAVSAGDTPVPEGATIRVLPEAETKLAVDVPDSAFESYDLVTPEGTERRDERIVAAYYSTLGTFSEDRAALRTDTVIRFRPPESVPANRSGKFWTVLRDTRGGQDWREHPLYVCDTSLPAPVVSELTPPSAAPGTVVTVRGENLGSVLELFAEGALLTDLRYIQSNGTLEARVPAIPAGTYGLRVATKLCSDFTATPTVTVLP